MIAAEQCHITPTFEGRPDAGVDPWDWWWTSFATTIPIYAEDLGRLWAMTRWHEAGPRIVFHYKLTGLQQREALTHEMHHLAIGGVCSSRCPDNERIVAAATARWLLPDVEAMAEQLQRHSMERAARELLVSRRIIWQRIEFLTSIERAAVDEIMRQPPQWAPQSKAATRLLAVTV